MADDKTLISSSGVDHSAVIGPFLQEFDALHRDLTSIRSAMTSFSSRREDGEEFDAASLVESDQSVKRLMSTIDGHASRLMQMAKAISAEARGEAVRAHAEFNEMHSDERRADALRRGIIPFAGGDGSHSVLSILAGAHSIGQGIFSFMTMID
jgi:hypothetical protein